MGMHLVIRKRGMTRDDVLHMVQNCPYCSIDNFIRDEHLEELAELCGEGSAPTLGLFVVPDSELQRLPDEWLNFDGEAVLNNMSGSSFALFQTVLGVELPEADYRDEYDDARSKGGRVMLIDLSSLAEAQAPAGESPDCPGDAEGVEGGAWLSPEELRSLLQHIPRERAEKAPAQFRMLGAIAERGFECAWIG